MNTTPVIIAILVLTALVTATISGIIGMGGGILLLAAMFSFMPHGEAIPLHAAVQLISNGTRIIAFWKAVDWRTVGRYLLGVVPGAVIATLVLWALGEPGRSEPYLKIVIGVYILVVPLLRKPKRVVRLGHGYDFTLLGLAAGSVALAVGAIGPLIAPLFARRNFVKEHLIATKAVCQMFTHALKIVAFSVLGTIEFAEFSLLLGLMAAFAVVGTFSGKRILRHVSPQMFRWLYRIALVVAGLKVLIVDGLLKTLSL